MKAMRVLLAYIAVLSLGKCTTAAVSTIDADATAARHADISNDAGFDGNSARTVVLATSTTTTRSSIEEQRGVRHRAAASAVRMLQLSDGSASADASAAPRPAQPDALSPPPPETQSPPPTDAPELPTITPVPSAPIPLPPLTPPPFEQPTPAPTLTPRPTLEPSQAPQPTLEPSQAPQPTPSNEVPLSSPAPTPAPTSETLQPPEPSSSSSSSSSPSDTPRSPPPQEPSRTPSPEGNVIFDIHVIDSSDERDTKHYTRSNAPSATTTTTTAAPKHSTRRHKHDSDDASDNNEHRSNSDTASSSSSTSNAPASPSKPNNVIGGRTRTNPINAVALSKTSSTIHGVVRQAASLFAGISVALLLFFHYAALDPRVQQSLRHPLWLPNTWECVLYVQYLQQIASLSQLALPRAPYFLSDFTDAFAWSLFIVSRAPQSDQSDQRRRLDAPVVVTGVVAFSDRVGLDEAQVLAIAALTFALVLVGVSSVYGVTLLLAKRRAATDSDKLDPFPIANAAAATTASVYTLRFVSLRFVGLSVVLWCVGLLPLSLFASFELFMQLDAQLLALGSFVLAVVVFVLCIGVVLQCARTLLHKSARDLADLRHLAVYGALYAAYTYKRRLFFVVVALKQLAAGVLIGAMTPTATAATASDATAVLLSVVLAIHVAYLGAVYFQAGFTSLSVGLFTFALAMIQIVNYALAFAFVAATNATSAVRTRAATAFILLNAVVLAAWFVRHAIVFVLTLQRLAQRRASSENDTTDRFAIRRQHAFAQSGRSGFDDLDDDDADVDLVEFVGQMVEFQTPVVVERSDGEMHPRTSTSSSSMCVLEPLKRSTLSNSSNSSSCGPRGSNVFVTMLSASPAPLPAAPVSECDRVRAPSSYTESSSSNASSLLPLRSTVKIAL